jgi:Kef-type K+ transport system membrane component KefB/mannitol/fructose-specific phosphotransferase system IIA component (Ntr-type)
MHHDVLLFLLSLALLLGVGRLAGEVARRLGAPAVVGEILAGLVIGKTVMGRFAPSVFYGLFPTGAPGPLLSGYTTVAVMLLLVVAGLEIDLNVVRRSSRTVLLTSAMGVVVPFALGWGMGHLLPGSDLADPSRRGLHAAFLGIALSISALPVIVRTLLDLGLLKTDLGLIIVSAAVFDDLAGWIGFSVLTREFHSGGTGGDLGRLAISVGLTALFVIVTLLVVRPIVDRLLARIQGKGEQVDSDLTNGRVLTLVMVMALVGAAATEALGMHAVFGGFVMGLAIGDSDRLREHTRNVLQEFVTSVFTPVFFATMAMRVDFAAAFDLRLTLIVLAISCLAKIGGCTVGARVGGIAWRQALAIGFGMNSRGAMEILLASLALEAKIINASVFVALVTMAIVTSLVSGPALTRLLRPRSSAVLAMLRAGTVSLDIAGSTPAAVIRTLAASLATRHGRAVEANDWASRVLAREDLAGTGVGEGVAIPHAEVPGITGPMLAFGRTAEPVDFDAPDGEPVRLVFVLLTPPRQFERELQVLAGVVRWVSDPAARQSLLEAAAPDAVLAALAAAERSASLTPVPAASMRPSARA